MMLHTRDCPGTTSTGDICPFPWCRKVKHLLYHLVSCERQSTCSICSTTGLSRNIRGLMALSEHRLRHRRKLLRERLSQDYVVTMDTLPSQTLSVSGVDVGQNQILSSSYYMKQDNKNETKLPSHVIDHIVSLETGRNESETQSEVSDSRALMVSTYSRKRSLDVDMESSFAKIDDNPLCKEEISSTELASIGVNASSKQGNIAATINKELSKYEITTQTQDADILDVIIDDIASDVNRGVTQESTTNSSSCVHRGNKTIVKSPKILSEQNEGIEHVSGQKALHDLDSSQAITTFTEVSDTGTRLEVFNNKANLSNNATYPSSDSLQSALAPFLSDHVDVSEFPSDELPCRIDTSSSLTAMASEFEEPILRWATTDISGAANATPTPSTTDNFLRLDEGMDSINPTNVTENTHVLHICKLEDYEKGETRMVPSRHIGDMLNDCSNSNPSMNESSSFTMSANNVSSMFKTEPDEIRKDRLSSENLVLRVQ
jgi:TAZ zinc finger